MQIRQSYYAFNHAELNSRTTEAHRIMPYSAYHSSETATVANQLGKYSFRVRSRAGPIVDRVRVTAKDRQEALKRLMQLYPGCEILECHDESFQAPEGSFENLVDLITELQLPQPVIRNKF